MREQERKEEGSKTETKTENHVTERGKQNQASTGAVRWKGDIDPKAVEGKFEADEREGAAPTSAHRIQGPIKDLAKPSIIVDRSRDFAGRVSLDRTTGGPSVGGRMGWASIASPRLSTPPPSPVAPHTAACPERHVSGRIVSIGDVPVA